MAWSFTDKISNSWIGMLIARQIKKIEFSVMKYYHDEKTMKLLKRIMDEDKPFLLKPSELFLLYSFANLQKDVKGDYAEVGAFKGATAKAICESKGNKAFHVFDTFEGLPKITKLDQLFKKGMFKADYELVKEKLSSYPNVYVHKGLFPKTATPIKNKKFAFVHLDVDIYQSTKDCIEFFYPRLSKNAILVSHDYHAAGVKKAFDDFFKNKPEKIVELPMSQCMIIKK